MRSLREAILLDLQEASNGGITDPTDCGTAVVIRAPGLLHAESMPRGDRSVEHVVTGEEFLSSIPRQRATVVVVDEALVVDAIRDVASELAVKSGETRVAVFCGHLTSVRCWF